MFTTFALLACVAVPGDTHRTTDAAERETGVGVPVVHGADDAAWTGGVRLRRCVEAPAETRDESQPPQAATGNLAHGAPHHPSIAVRNIPLDIRCTMQSHRRIGQ